MSLNTFPSKFKRHLYGLINPMCPNVQISTPTLKAPLPPPCHCRALFEVEAGDLVHNLQLHVVWDGLTRPVELHSTRHCPTICGRHQFWFWAEKSYWHHCRRSLRLYCFYQGHPYSIGQILWHLKTGSTFWPEKLKCL